MHTGIQKGGAVEASPGTARGYALLKRNSLFEAEQSFTEVLRAQPKNGRALAGMGFVRLKQGNFAAAISFFSTAATTPGGHDAAVARGLRDARFLLTLQEARQAEREHHLSAAGERFQAALGMRPGDPAALEGLGSTLLASERPQAAAVVFATYTRLHPADAAGWKGLYLANARRGPASLAVATERRMPVRVRAALLHDPEFLHAAARVDTATAGRAKGERRLVTAVQNPAAVEGGTEELQLQYAALQQADRHYAEAAGVYRKVLAGDKNSMAAWVGIIESLHALGRDAEACLEVEAMPADLYQKAAMEPEFGTVVAAVSLTTGHDEVARMLLERLLAASEADGQKAPPQADLALGDVYLRREDSIHAFPLYATVLREDPSRARAWKGLLAALHNTGHDAEALAQMGKIPAPVRQELASDPGYQEVLGAIYEGLHEWGEALGALREAEREESGGRLPPPPALEVRLASVLLQSGDDAALFAQLMKIARRDDLDEPERREIEGVWASWSLRRAQQYVLALDPQRAIDILNASFEAFSDSPHLLREVAAGYVLAGQPRDAVQIFHGQNLSEGTPEDYRAAVKAALMVRDRTEAEAWLRMGRRHYPDDAELLTLAAQIEQARGHKDRARLLYQSALAAGPAAGSPAPAAASTAALKRKAPGSGTVATAARGRAPVQPFEASGAAILH